MASRITSELRNQPFNRRARTEKIFEDLARRGSCMRLEHWDPRQLRIEDSSKKTLDRAELRRLKKSIKKLGFIGPILVTSLGRVLDGRVRLVIALELGMAEVPVLVIDRPQEDDVIALKVALRKIDALLDWSRETAGEAIAPADRSRIAKTGERQRPGQPGRSQPSKVIRHRPSPTERSPDCLEPALAEPHPQRQSESECGSLSTPPSDVTSGESEVSRRLTSSNVSSNAKQGQTK